jgi:hypothetical protein
MKRKSPLPYYIFKRYLEKKGLTFKDDYWGRVYGFYCKSFKTKL